MSKYEINSVSGTTTVDGLQKTYTLTARNGIFQIIKKNGKFHVYKKDNKYTVGFFHYGKTYDSMETAMNAIFGL